MHGGSLFIHSEAIGTVLLGARAAVVLQQAKSACRFDGLWDLYSVMAQDQPGCLPRVFPTCLGPSWGHCPQVAHWVFAAAAVVVLGHPGLRDNLRHSQFVGW